MKQEQNVLWNEIVELYRKGGVIEANNYAYQELKYLIWNLADKTYKRIESYVPDKRDLKEELFHSGVIGLLNALQRYDPQRNCMPSSFFYMHILGSMNIYVAKEVFGRTKRENDLICRISRAKNDYERNQKTYSLEDISQMTGKYGKTTKISPKIIKRLGISMQKRIPFEDLTDYEDTNSQDLCLYVETKELKQIFMKSLEQLTQMERFVFLHRNNEIGTKISYKELSHITQKSEKELKKIYTHSICKLKNDKDLIAYLNPKNK